MKYWVYLNISFFKSENVKNFPTVQLFPKVYIYPNVSLYFSGHSEKRKFPFFRVLSKEWHAINFEKTNPIFFSKQKSVSKISRQTFQDHSTHIHVRVRSKLVHQSQISDTRSETKPIQYRLYFEIGVETLNSAASVKLCSVAVPTKGL